MMALMAAFSCKPAVGDVWFVCADRIDGRRRETNPTVKLGIYTVYLSSYLTNMRKPFHFGHESPLDQRRLGAGTTDATTRPGWME
jgi:hypothetical protein